MKEDGLELRSPAKTKNPFPTNYRPEIDVTEELGPDLLSRYLQLIGMLRWAVELGRLDIYLEVSLLSQYQASPRAGHLDALYHIFAYLRGHPNMGRIAYDPVPPKVDYSVFNDQADWKPFYGEAEEELPPKIPDPLGHAVSIHAFVDANHAGNVVTRRSHSGIIIFVNNAPILWFTAPTTQAAARQITPVPRRWPQREERARLAFGSPRNGLERVGRLGGES